MTRLFLLVDVEPVPFVSDNIKQETLFIRPMTSSEKGIWVK